MSSNRSDESAALRLHPPLSKPGPGELSSDKPGIGGEPKPGYAAPAPAPIVGPNGPLCEPSASPADGCSASPSAAPPPVKSAVSPSIRPFALRWPRRAAAGLLTTDASRTPTPGREGEVRPKWHNDHDMMAKLFGRRMADDETRRRGSSGEPRSSFFGIRWHEITLHPLQRERMWWDALMTLLIIWSAIEIPFMIAFVEQQITAILVMDWIVDVVFMIDLGVCFLTGYVDQDDGVTMELRAVICHYLRGWFLIDFISAFPFDRCVEAAEGSSDVTGQLLNFVRML